MTFRLYLLQHLTATLMAPLIVGHLAMIIYATHSGLSAAEILARTRGSFGWALFYGLFVLFAAVHSAIGVRTVVAEWTSWYGRALDFVMWGFGSALLLLGARAVYAVVAP